MVFMTLKKFVFKMYKGFLILPHFFVYLLFILNEK